MRLTQHDPEQCRENGEFDDDCCATEGAWSCASGYKLVHQRQVCHDAGDWQAYKYQCIPLERDPEADLAARYKMGQGKCRAHGDRKTSGFTVAPETVPNVYACKDHCDKAGDACTAFHFFKVGHTAPAGACVFWEDQGLAPNDDPTADCYVKISEVEEKETGPAATFTG